MTENRREALHRFLFRSEPLGDDSWAARHRFIRGVAAVQLPALAVFALLRGTRPEHVVLEVSGLGIVIALASVGRFDRRTKEGLGTFAVMLTSALLVHISAGSIEAHFHFFVMLAVISLYQSWFAFILGIGFVLVHHGLLGTLHAGAVFNHGSAIRSPWKWAGIHAFFVAGASAIYVIQWRLNEMSRNDARALYKTLYEGQKSLVKQLEETATMKDELVSVVSHELRTPLTSIIGYVEMLREFEGLDPVESTEYLAQVARQADRLHFLIENLMNYQRADHAEDGSTDVSSLVDDVIEQQSGYPGANALTFRAEVAEGLRCTVAERAMRLILSNLINNAVKYSAEGTEVLVRARSRKMGDGTETELVVANEGAPIRPEDRERMFGAFVQLDSSVTRSVPGVGLGLHIVGRAVAAHGGSVTVDCVDNRVIFTVVIPETGPSTRASSTRSGVTQFTLV